jgi:hypothetical protein
MKGEIFILLSFLQAITVKAPCGGKLRSPCQDPSSHSNKLHVISSAIEIRVAKAVTSTMTAF